MRSKATIVLVAILVAPAVAALAAIVSAQESDVPTDIRGESLTCPSGGQVESRFTLNGDAWVVTGILQTGLIGTITVSGPTGDVSVTPTVNLAITGDPQLGQPVTMAGKIAMTGEMVATTIVDACVGAPAVPASPSAEDDPAGHPVSNEDGDQGKVSNDSDDAESDGDGDSDDSAGNQKIAEAIAEEFDTTPEEVLALHDEGIGFGAIFKLYLIARANDMTVGDLLAQVDDDGGFAFGKLKKSLTEEEMAIFEDGPKNLGELVSSSNHDDSDDSEDADEEDNGKSKGHGNKD